MFRPSKLLRQFAMTAASCVALAACACSGGVDGIPPNDGLPTPTPTATPTPTPTPTSTPSRTDASVLFWTKAEKLAGFPHMEDLYSHRVVSRGAGVAPLPQAADTFDAMLTIQNEIMTLDEYMDQNDTAGFLIIKDGQITAEKYALGHSESGRWTSFSVAKSVSSTLLGAALKDGDIGSVDDLVTDYLPTMAGSGYDGVTIRQVLNMTSGVAWNEDYTDPNSDVAQFANEPSTNGSDPTVTYMSRLESEAQPGTKWLYKTGETNLVGSIVRAATGKLLADYLSERIWSPFGMEQDAVWLTDAGDFEIAGCCISASLRDYGRFGQFFLDGAQVNGVSIVPDDWINEATTTTQVALDAMGGHGGYGYQWWTTDGAAYAGYGIFGQLIWINPDLNLVIVTQSAWPDATSDVYGARRTDLISSIEAHYAQP